MSTRTSILSNGLRVVTASMPSVESVSLGVWVGTGTRSEPASINGVAHFLEHMAFKGTNTRTALDIASEIEAVGGHLNAYTSRECTAYYVRVLKGDVALAVDIISDILQNPTFEEVELDRERGVILQEIGQAFDTPDDIVFDHFQEAAFPNQAMGRPVLGTSDLVTNMPRDEIMKFMKNRYCANNLVLAAAGNVDHDLLVQLAERYFSGLHAGEDMVTDVGTYQGGEYREDRDSEQVHLVMGFPGVAFHDDDQFASNLTANILGGGMSSRLFQEVREKRGLAYSVYAFSSSFDDCGVFGIYAGTGEKEASELTPVICDELMKLCDDVSEKELAMNQTQMKASFLMSLESTTTRADQLGNQILTYGKPWTVDELVQKIEDISVEDIKRVAQRMFKGPMTIAALGPLGSLEGMDKLQARMR